MIESVNAPVKITGKRFYIDQARKSPDYAGDRDDKDLLRNILWKNFGIAAIEPPNALECLDGTHIWADLRTTNYKPVTYFEMHGPYHPQINDSSDYTYRFPRL